MRTILLLSLIASPMFAAISEADLSEFTKKFSGKFLVIKSGTDVRVSGKTQTEVNADTINIETTVVSLSDKPFSQAFVYNIKESDLKIKDGNFTLEYEKGEIHKVNIFKPKVGYFEVSYTDCDENGCRLGSYQASQGAAPGDAVDSRVFFKGLKKEYTFGNGFLTVDLGKNPDEVSIKYLTETLTFAFAKTKVYVQDLSTTDKLYLILKEEGGLPALYHWEDRPQTVAFRNYATPKELILNK